ncbi:MAG TPA: molybdenum cofactor guanylyltransferase [Solirubrobacteraceae bacterium]|nr:molybdenum cofactor guanylyltransferase [Solirubrobacteraceae bacterium]
MTVRAAAAVVLAGGRSTRMGTPKAMLEWHGSTLARRAVGIAARAVGGPVVLVRAQGQKLPHLPGDVEIAEDAHDGGGPLQGLAAGLRAVGDRAEIVFVCGVDAPLLHPAVIRRVIALLDAEADVALPRAHGFAQPLCAAYRTRASTTLDELLAEDPQPGSRRLLSRLHVVELSEAQLLADPAVAALDPALDSLLNVNERKEYAAARSRPAPEVVVAVEGDVAERAVHAATLEAAIDAAGLAPATDLRASVNGSPAGDPQEPLVQGDSVTLWRDASTIV